MTEHGTGREARLGVFGGTFDPPHLGHLAAARAARDALGLGHVLFVVAADPWQKEGTVASPAGDRFEMVQLLVADEADMSASRIEIERGGPSYTIDTLETLARPEGRRWRPPHMRDVAPHLYLVLGSDAAARLQTWHRSAEIPDLARIVVVSRDGGTNPTPDFPDGLLHVRMPAVPVSSTDVRDALGRGLDPHLVPVPVLDYVRRHRLYGSNPASPDG